VGVAVGGELSEPNSAKRQASETAARIQITKAIKNFRLKIPTPKKQNSINGSFEGRDAEPQVMGLALQVVNYRN
jgi:hypothetical protein